MKGPFLVTVLVNFCIAASAQVNVDSMQQRIDHVLDKVHVDSLEARLPQLPDSLLTAYQKVDSIRTAFSDAADSIQTEYRLALSKLDAPARKVNNTIDSLS